MVMLFFIRGQTLMSSCGTGGLSVFAFFVSTDHFPAVVKHEMPFWHGFKKGNEELRDQVQKILEEMAADGTLKTISEKWFGRDVTTIGK